MDKCETHLNEYILKEDADKRVSFALKENSSYYTELLRQQREDHANAQQLLIERYSRADTFLTYIYRKTCQLAIAKQSKLNWDWFDNTDFHTKTEACNQVEILLQMGMDFQTLLNTIKQDEILNHQWRSIVMVMRLAGYDSFDKQKDI